jgi:hypothetical protein
MLQMARKPFMVPPWGSRRLPVKAENLVLAAFGPQTAPRGAKPMVNHS